MSTAVEKHAETAGPAPAAAVVADLVSAGLVDQHEASAARLVVAGALERSARGGVRSTSEPRPARSGLVEIAAYAGAALVVAAIGLFLAEQWNSFSGTAQVAILATAGVLLGGAGVVVASRPGLPSGIRRRLSSTLLTAGALGIAAAVVRLMTLVDEDFTSGPTFAGAAVMIVLTATAYAFVPSAVGLVALAVALLIAVPSGLELVSVTDNALGPALAFLGVGAVWTLFAEIGWIHERTVGRSIGVAFAVFGAQSTLFDGTHNNLGYALTLMVAVLGFGLYLRTTAWPYLVAGVLALTLGVSEAVIDWTDGSLGIAGAMLVAGLTLLGASVAGLRLRQGTHD